MIKINLKHGLSNRIDKIEFKKRIKDVHYIDMIDFYDKDRAFVLVHIYYRNNGATYIRYEKSEFNTALQDFLILHKIMEKNNDKIEAG